MNYIYWSIAYISFGYFIGIAFVGFVVAVVDLKSNQSGSNNNLDYNYGALAGSFIGGGWAGGITRGLGPVTSARVGWAPSVGSTAIGTAIGKRF